MLKSTGHEKDQQEHFLSLSEEEKIKLVAMAAANVRKNYTVRQKASDSAYNYNGDRTGIRGGRRTTLDAKLSTACRVYDESVEYLKTITNLL